MPVPNGGQLPVAPAPVNSPDRCWICGHLLDETDPDEPTVGCSRNGEIHRFCHQQIDCRCDASFHGVDGLDDVPDMDR